MSAFCQDSGRDMAKRGRAVQRVLAFEVGPTVKYQMHSDTLCAYTVPFICFNQVSDTLTTTHIKPKKAWTWKKIELGRTL